MASETAAIAMRVSRDDVAYLALEGGGGKGVTYLGAIRALERMEILPIDIRRPGENQIIGISGASAGAITALLLSLGLNSRRIADLLGHPEIFNGFSTVQTLDAIDWWTSRAVPQKAANRDLLR
jgi:predicted acylesterase/phospholipase RssA